MIEIQIRTTKETKDFLKEFPKMVRRGLEKGMKRAMLFAESEAKKSFGRSGHLKVRTGHLRRSIRSRVKERAKQIIGSIGTDVLYARIHEQEGFRGQTRTITPRQAQFLRFKVENRWVTLKSVTIPSRPFLRPAIEDNLIKIENILRDSVLQEVK